MTAIFYRLFISLLPVLIGFGKDIRSSAPHPFYVSVTEINHSSKDKALQISCKLFADDLERTLEQNYKTQLDLTDAKYKATLDKLINDYINKHLAIAADGKNTKLNYVGFERDKEAAYCYFEVPNMPTVKKVDITNSLLYDFNNQEINIMHVVVNGNRKSYKLDYPNTTTSFVF